MSSTSRIRQRSTLGEGRWLKLEQLTWTQDDGREHQWEAVSRTGDGRCVLVIALLKPSNTLVLVKQYRPAIDGLSIEFPAGLVDKGEQHEQAALRELKEETGYVGELVSIQKPGSVSSGLTSEAIAMATVHIDERLPENQNPQTQHEASESMETLLIPKDQWKNLLQDQDDGSVVDAKLRSFILGISISQNL